MIALIAPAKRLDYDSDLSVEDFSVAEHLKESKKLIKELQKKSPEELSSLMGLSENLSVLNFERNMNWQVPKKPSDEVRQAIFAFKGDVYVGLDSETLSKSDIKYAQKNLAILSGLYGLLKPLDLMYPYRLEMGTKMKNENGKNLYEFWGNKITTSINALAKENNSKGIINLASVEYFTSVKTENLDLPVYSPVFKDFKNGKYKIISFFAKKARGSMARFVIQNKIKNPADLNKFNLDDYKYSAKDSSEYSPVFLRN